MIVKEKLTISNKEYIRQYSDEGYYIEGGSPKCLYSVAIDIEERDYIETDIKIEEV